MKHYRATIKTKNDNICERDIVKFGDERKEGMQHVRNFDDDKSDARDIEKGKKSVILYIQRLQLFFKRACPF